MMWRLKLVIAFHLLKSWVKLQHNGPLWDTSIQMFSKKFNYLSSIWR